MIYTDMVMEKTVVKKNNIACTRYPPSLTDFLIINIPAFTAICGSITGFYIAYFFSSRFFPLFLFFFVIAWQSLCASVMLLIDYFVRKQYVFQRLKALHQTRSSSIEKSLHLENTFCGIALKLAVMRRNGCSSVNHILEEEAQ